MYLKYLQIVNYKNLKGARFEFLPGSNTIIGENDSGKSNAMTALRILLDDTYYYNSKRLKESDFSDILGDWRGHWIIISAYFDGITSDEQQEEVCKEITPQTEDENFLKSYIRCDGSNYGTVTLYIRPGKAKRKELSEAQTPEEFEKLLSIHKNDLVVKIAEILKSELTSGIPENEICIVAPTWFKIFPFTNQLKKIMPDTEFDAPDISPIKRDPLNIFYLISKLLFTQYNGRIAGRKRTATDILNILHMDFGVLIADYADNYLVLKAINATHINQADGISTIKMAVNNLWNSLKINIENYPSLKSTYLNFFNKIDSRIKQFNLSFDYVSMEKCFKERKGIVIKTIHGVKGEEYTTMIGFSLLHGVIPNWKITREPNCHDETCKLLYVMCSRAKKNLYLFSESGYFTRGYNPRPYTATKELQMCDFDYDLSLLLNC